MAAETEPVNNMSFYDTYKNAGRSPELIALHGGRWLISIIGLSMNVTLICATIKSKNLHHRCNFLIAAEAFANGLYQLAPTTTFLLALTGIDFITLQSCLLLQAVPLFGVHMSLLCSMFIGLDRLLSIRFPLWINKQNRRRYVAILLTTAFTYGVIYVAQCYKLCEWYGFLKLEVMCTITLDCFQGLLVEAKCLYSVMTINTATVLIYCGLFATVRQRARHVAATNSKNAAAYVFTQRILKSLIWITCLNILGWCLATAARMVHPYLFGNNEFRSVMFVNAVSYLTNLTSASSAPVLFLCSEEYRRAFRRLLGSHSDVAPSMTHLSATPNPPRTTLAEAETKSRPAEMNTSHAAAVTQEAHD